MFKVNFIKPLGDRKGFTLVELLIVVTIIMLLVGLVGQNVFKRLGKGKQGAAKAQVEIFGAGLDDFRMDMDRYPTTQEGLEALITNPSSEKWDGPYLKKQVIPKDPWGRPYVYQSPGTHGEYDLYSYGRDGSVGGDNEDKDIISWQ
ncbi:MAG: type II secretion system major pseudopilin GspG [Nitrospirae bacterium]|nr:type II secretion system major pseudopilin GspG [Nitrospirota bacterium]